VKAGDDKQGFALHDKEQCVWKPAQKGTAHVLENGRELPRVRGHVLGHGIDGGAKAAAEAGRLAFVPILRVNYFRAGRRSEYDCEHLRATSFEFGLQRGPR
jgi:hypothetical protein